jgi:hypothetical protein
VSATRSFQKIKEIEPDNNSADVDIQNCIAVRQFKDLADSAFQSSDYRKVAEIFFFHLIETSFILIINAFKTFEGRLFDG